MTETLEAAVASCVTELGFDLEAVELTSGGKRRLLRIAIDGDDGVGIDDIADTTRALSVVLDADDSLMGPAPYTLEVTSRGVDRPLTAPRHWRRNTDRLVRVRLVEGEVTEGRIGPSDDAGVDLLTKSATRRIEYADMESAIIQAELNPRPTTGPTSEKDI